MSQWSQSPEADSNNDFHQFPILYMTALVLVGISCKNPPTENFFPVTSGKSLDPQCKLFNDRFSIACGGLGSDGIPNMYCISIGI